MRGVGHGGSHRALGRHLFFQTRNVLPQVVGLRPQDGAVLTMVSAPQGPWRCIFTDHIFPQLADGSLVGGGACALLDNASTHKTEEFTGFSDDELFEDPFDVPPNDYPDMTQDVLEATLVSSWWHGDGRRLAS